MVNLDHRKYHKELMLRARVRIQTDKKQTVGNWKYMDNWDVTGFSFDSDKLRKWHDFLNQTLSKVKLSQSNPDFSKKQQWQKC